MEESQQNPSTAIDELHNRLQEAEDTVRAIRAGEIDALVVTGPLGEKVFILRGADHPYQVIVEEMNEGAATVSPEGARAFKVPCAVSTVTIWVVPRYSAARTVPR